MNLRLSATTLHERLHNSVKVRPSRPSEEASYREALASTTLLTTLP